MKLYELPAGTRIEVIEHDMLVNVDCRQWNVTYSTRDSFFDISDIIDFVSVTNCRKDHFPGILKELIKADKNLIIMRKIHKGKIYYAKASMYQLTYMG